MFCPRAVFVKVSFDGHELVEVPYTLDRQIAIRLPSSRATGTCQSHGLEDLFGLSNLLPFWLVGESSPPLHLQITGQTLHHHFLGEGVDIDSYTVRIQPIQGRIEVVRLDRNRARGFRIVDQQFFYPVDQPPVLIYDLEPARCRLIIHLAPTTAPFDLKPPATYPALEKMLQRASPSADDLVGTFKNG